MPIRGVRRPHVVPITAPSFPMSPQPRVYRKIAYTFVAFTIVIVIAVLWLSSVRAEVVVKVKRDTVALDGTVEVAKEPKNGQIPGRVLEGVFHEIQEFEVKDAASMAGTAAPTPVPAPAPATAPSGPVIAKGTVRIINKYSRQQTLVEKTRLLTADNKLYRIDKRINIPAGGEVTVGAYADQPGAEFVIGPTKFTIPGLWVDLQKYIYAQSDQAFRLVPFTEPLPAPAAPSTPTPKPATPLKPGKTVTQTHLDDAHKILYDAVFEEAKKRLMAEVGEGKFSEAVYLVKSQKKTANVSVGQTADKFLASVELDIVAVFYPKEDMLALIRSKLKEKIPEGREFLPLADGTVEYKLESADAKTELSAIRAKVNGSYRLTPQSPALQKELIAGKSRTDAVAQLKAIEGVEDVTITIKPGWLGKLPSLKDRIELRVE